MIPYLPLEQYRKILESSARKEKHPLDLSQYGITNLGKFGDGGCGSVYHVSSKKNPKKTYACKMISFAEFDPKADAIANSAVNEVELFMETLKDCESVVKCCGCLPKLEKVKKIQEELKREIRNPDQNYHILIFMEKGIDFTKVMDYLLEQYARRLPREIALSFMISIFESLASIHERNLVHRDIKPPNLLMVCRDDVLRPVISDFNISRIQLTEDTHMNFTHGIGTRAYAAPEMHIDEKPEVIPVEMEMAQKVDVYSMALMCYQMINGGLLPFEREYKGNIDYAITRRNEGKAIPPAKYTPSNKLDALIRRALSHNPYNRPTAAEMLAELKALYNHPQDDPLVPQGKTGKRKGSKKRILTAALLAASIITAGFVWDDAVCKIGDGFAADGEEAKAISCYAVSAKYGDEDAQKKMGDYYYAKAEYPIAAQWYAEAVKSGDASACVCLGDLYYNGLGVTQDDAAAAACYTQAVKRDKENPAALIALARCYFYGRGVAQDYPTAAALCETPAAAGDTDALLMLGDCYYNGLGTIEQDAAKGASCYEKAAAQGCAEAQDKLGTCFFTGTGMTQNIVKAKEWYEKAAAQQYAASYGHLADCYHADQDYAAAFSLYEQAIQYEEIEAEAAYHLGLYYYNGYGTEQNLEKALQYYLFAAEKDHIAAQSALGCHYYDWKEYGTAVKWLQKAAKHGDILAQSRLADCYYFGYTLEEDPEYTFALYMQTAEQGDAKGQLGVGRCYYHGHGVQANKKEALQWLQQAASQGALEAQEMIDANYG